MADPTPPGSGLTLGKLLIASLIVAPMSSCGGSLIVAGGVAATSPGVESVGQGIFAALFVLVIATIMSVFGVIIALWVIALPLTLILAQRGVAQGPRELILLGVAVGAALLLWPASVYVNQGSGWILPVYALASAGLWVIALRYLDQSNRI